MRMNEKKVQDLKIQIAEVQQRQQELEERIYKDSVANKQRHDDKDMLLLLLPQIVKEQNRKNNNIKMLLNQIQNDHLRAKVMKMF